MSTLGKSTLRPLVIFSDATLFGDDGVAIALLLASPKIHVSMIVAVSGNVWAEESEDAIREILRRLNRQDIPVYRETGSSFDSNLRRSEFSTGKPDYVRYAGSYTTPRPTQRQNSTSTLDDLADRIWALGIADWLILCPASTPITLLHAYPRLISTVNHISLMGGALTVSGNSTEFAEFNIWFDPTAADQMLKVGLPVTMLPLDPIADLSYRTSIHRAGNSSSPAEGYLSDRLSEPSSKFVCDEVLAAVLIDCRVASQRKMLHLTINTSSDVLSGSTQIVEGVAGRPVDVITEVDIKRLSSVITDCLRSDRFRVVRADLMGGDVLRSEL